MPRRPVAKKAPAKPKRKAQKAVVPYRPISAAKANYHQGFEDGAKRVKELEDRTVEQAEYITKQERTIARLLSLINDKGP